MLTEFSGILEIFHGILKEMHDMLKVFNANLEKSHESVRNKWNLLEINDILKKTMEPRRESFLQETNGILMEINGILMETMDSSRKLLECSCNSMETLEKGGVRKKIKRIFKKAIESLRESVESMVASM